MVNNAAADSLIGRTLGRRYALLTRVASGGMATVYRAHDRQLDRVVAVKVPRGEFVRSKQFSEQFRREARAAGRLSHPNVVAVYDSGEERGLPYIVMEYVNGQTLRDLLELRGRLDVATTGALLGGVAAGLDHAHQSGIVHLDIKPENILLTSETVKVVDFGLVRAAQARPEEQLAGTVHYVPPEVLRGAGVDGRADVYSLGIVAFECLTGKPPFDGSSREDVVRRHLEERVPRPSTLVPGLPTTVDYAILAATEPDPNRRYRRVTEFTAALGVQRPWTSEHTAALAAATTSVLAAAPAGSQPNGHQLTLPADRSIQDGRVDEDELTAAVAHRRAVRRWPLIAAVAAGVVLLSFLVVLAAQLIAASGQATVPDVVGSDFEEASDTLTGLGLEVERGTPVPSRTIDEGRVAEQSIDPDERVSKGTRITLNPSSGNPTVTVPEVRGRPEQEAREALEQAGFSVTVEQRTSREIEAGQAIGTDPGSGQEITEESVVKLLVSSGPPTTQVPEIAGQTIEEAEQALESAGLGITVRTEPAFNVEAGRVVRTEPGAGTEIAQGTDVLVVVSTGLGFGDNGEVQMPSLEGRRLDEAIQELQRAGLASDLNLPRETRGREDRFRVRDQEPDAGETVNPNEDRIRIRIERDNDDDD